MENMASSTQYGILDPIELLSIVSTNYSAALLALDNIIIVLIIAQSTVRDMKSGALSNFKRPNGSAKCNSELFFLAL